MLFMRVRMYVTSYPSSQMTLVCEHTQGRCHQVAPMASFASLMADGAPHAARLAIDIFHWATPLLAVLLMATVAIFLGNLFLIGVNQFARRLFSNAVWAAVFAVTIAVVPYVASPGAIDGALTACGAATTFAQAVAAKALSNLQAPAEAA